MEGAHGNVIVIAATNRIDLVDPSVLRPGRLGTQFYLPLPGHEERLEIFEKETRGLGSRVHAEQFFANLARQTEGWSGADIHAACTQARMNALKRTNYQEMPPLIEADFTSAIRQLGSAKRGKERLALV
jgi:ATP-dependent 26S proteasome regulatory subunit